MKQVAKLLKNRVVALVLTAAVILAMSLWGIHKAPAKLPGVETGTWVYDGAGVLSAEEESYLAQGNAGLLSGYGSVVAVATVPNTKGWDLWDFCLRLGESWGLNGSDFILVLDVGGDSYWLVQGYNLMDAFTDEMCSQYARQYLENDFAAKRYGAGAVALFDALVQWFDTHGVSAPAAPSGAGLSFYDNEPVSSGGVGFGGVLLLLVFLVILVVALDGLRYRRYRSRVVVMPSLVYHPFLFGRPRRPAPPPPHGPNRRGPGPGGGSFGGGRPSGGSFGGGRSSGGSFGGGRSSGGSFGGGRPSGGSFGGGRSSGGSFGGGRTGSFGGGRSGGFGGGRR